MCHRAPGISQPVSTLVRVRKSHPDSSTALKASAMTSNDKRNDEMVFLFSKGKNAGEDFKTITLDMLFAVGFLG